MVNIYLLSIINICKIMINVSNQNNHQDILPNLDIKCEPMFKECL